jgi:hypothetical protein
MFNAESVNFKETLLRYIFKCGHNHKSERIRGISLWSIDQLGLLVPKDKKRETIKIKNHAKTIVKQKFQGDADNSVREIANHILKKYSYQFL